MFMNKLLLTFLAFFIVQNVYSQNDPCKTVEQCKQILNQAKARLAELEKTSLYVSTIGPKFKRMEKQTKLGEAWRDSAYLVWGDVYHKGKSVIQVNFQQAQEYCKGIGAELPTAEDFVRLKISMGASHTDVKKKGDYTAQILPNLNVFFSVWTSTSKTLADGRKQAVLFQGMMGRFDEKDVNSTDAGVRCVMKAWDFKKL